MRSSDISACAADIEMKAANMAVEILFMHLSKGTERRAWCDQGLRCKM
jgi:hypothetical protein